MDPNVAMRFVQDKLTLYRKRMDVSAIKDLISRIRVLKTPEDAEDLVMRVILCSTGAMITSDIYANIVTALESQGSDIFKASAILSLGNTTPFYSVHEDHLILTSGVQKHTRETISNTIKLRIAFLQRHLLQYVNTTFPIGSKDALFASCLNSCKHLSSLALLEGNNSSCVLVAGVLHDTHDALQLEDETALVTLLLDKIKYNNIQNFDTFFLENQTQVSLPLLNQAVVAVVGSVEGGKLRANAIFTPLIETPESFNALMGTDKTPAYKSIFSTVHTNTPEFGLVFSQVFFSDSRCVNDLLLMLKEYDRNTESKHIPSHIIIFGVFCEGRQSSPSNALLNIKKFLDALITEQLTKMTEHTLFVFAPHKADPSLTGDVYPRQLFSKKTVDTLRTDYQTLKLSFPTTPFHLAYGHQTLVLSSMPHEEVFLNLTKDSTVMTEIEEYYATHEELANFIVAQKNLFPFPHSTAPWLWGADPLLNLLPLPNSIILADGAFARCSVASGVTVASPGSFYTDRTYVVFHAAKTNSPIDILQLSKQMDSAEL
ncbi:DNA pol epsilon, sub B [Giardia duodenalis]|uniref:DNA polymerase II subunit 2 n=1 Tax=Giardia intestinalis (strain ATCC 50803 / WB clone C6) TaxID=184922 RepID=A8BUB9_GIAIC|nr:DNA pol epsilon, sub B [Giardia intestinalis]KAE8305498.1 DNA pol epsilon, sub B [Giardia intestinalis]|eukprot:XP_001704752.1 DNA pol epsilon, sub B [Giardia lamblia ATCC 50803]